MATQSSTKHKRPTVAIIGAGRLGSALAIALQSCGYPIVALVARRRHKAEKATALLSELLSGSSRRPLALAANQLAELPLTDLIILATPDDAIAATAEKLSIACIAWKGGVGTVLHTSGALSSEVLAPLRERGWQTGSIHPLVSVSNPTAGAADLKGAFFCLEGTKKAETLAKSIVRNLGGNSFSIKPENKALYHAAAVMASPHLTALFDLALGMLAAAGLSRQQAQRVFIPLLESTVNNLKVSTTQEALTGTFARGDVDTVQRHLKALSGKDLADALAVYKLLGLHSLEMASKNKVDSTGIEAIQNLLGSKRH